MAYERVITACDRVEQVERDRAAQWLQVFHDEAVRAQAILVELMSGLAVNHPDPDVAALSANLENLYHYAIQELVQANTTKSPEPIAAVRLVVDGLHDAWVTGVR